jgi:predicted Rossmann-fold nucleotide-binding protein
MKLAVTGGRDHLITPDDLSYLGDLVASQAVTEIISGGARGVDRAVEQWANSHGILVRRVSPDWSQGKSAGFANNERMAALADALVAFPGGSGTRHMVNFCRDRGMRIFESRSRQSSIGNP